jgi:pimeloyl-ACP methyl ester carboxylesterase
VRELDVALPDGRNAHVYDTGPGQPGADSPCVFWHHGTPQSGLLPEPLLPVLAQAGARLVSADRPGYGSSTADPGRTVAAVAGDAAAIADALAIGRFAVLGASGGGPHALACAALLGDRVPATGCLASPAPYDAADLDWFGDMAPSGVAEFTAAARSRSALVAHLRRSSPEDLDEFAPADMAVFAGPYGAWLVDSSTQGLAGGFEGAVEDDQALVRSWGFDVATISTPVLLVQGGADRFVPSSHARWLGEHCATAEQRISPEDGHISVFDHAEETLGWILDRF